MKCPISNRVHSTAYMRDKCRCPDCVAWHSEYMKARRAKDPEKTRRLDRENKARQRQARGHTPEWKATRKRANHKYYRTAEGQAAVYRASFKRQARYDTWAEHWTDENHAAWNALVAERERLNAETGVPHHIDHIWTLCSGGPHHPANCRVITAEENLRRAKDSRY